MKKNILNIAVAATLGLAAFAVSAEDMYRGAWYALPGISHMDTDNDLEANNGGGAFIKLGKELSEHWDIQGGVGYNRASEDTGIAGVGGRYKQTTLGVDALYMFSREKFRPFLLAGLGVARNDVDYSHASADVDAKKTSWMANVGLGAQYLFSDSFGLQADVRHQLSRAKTTTDNGAFDRDTRTIGNTLVSLGGIFRFGVPAVMPVAAVEPEAAPVAPAPAPVAAAEPAPAPVCEPQYETITIEASKLFGFDEAKLKDTSVLDNEVVPKMKENKIFATVKVVGHTDKLGSEAYNQKLSEKRANQVRDYLIAKGVEADRLIAVGKGEMIPLVACDGVKGRKALIECLAPNRRVEIEATRSLETGCK
jgi:OOP family OmpA-OmpF porin